VAVIPEGKLQLPLLLHALLVVIPAGNLLLLLLLRLRLRLHVFLVVIPAGNLLLPLLLPLPLPLSWLLFVFRRHSERSEEPPHSPVLAVALP